MLNYLGSRILKGAPDCHANRLRIVKKMMVKIVMKKKRPGIRIEIEFPFSSRTDRQKLKQVQLRLTGILILLRVTLMVNDR